MVMVNILLNLHFQISEAPCPEGETPCGSGECVSAEVFCDGFADCPDRSDELYCCPEGVFNCANGRCIEWDAWCDGTDNCRDNSDEDQCAGMKLFSSRLIREVNYKRLRPVFFLKRYNLLLLLLTKLQLCDSLGHVDNLRK